MNISIKAIRFDATEKLEEYITKKLEKIAKAAGEANVEVVLKVVKPQAAMNKEVEISLPVNGKSLRASKVADTFEEAVLDCIDSIKVQIEKSKERHSASKEI